MKTSLSIQQKISAAFTTAGIKPFLQKINHALPNTEWYLVGGYVRDALLRRPSKDIDLVVRGIPAKKLHTMLRSLGTVNLVGKNFGVFKFIARGSEATIDIALPRTEHAFGTGGHRDVDVQSDWRLPIEDDLSRRDFTVNALAWNINESCLIDPFHGAADLKKRIIRAVGKPEIRFREDYSRLLRAIRFACQLNFEIETNTWKSLVASMKHINRKRSGERVVPYEIIAKELSKSFLADPPRALDLFDESGALKALVPELLAMKKCPQPREYHREGDVWTHTRLALAVTTGKPFRREFGSPDAETIFSVLFHDIAKPKTITFPKKAGERIRFDGHDTRGAEMTREIAERLRLSSYRDELIDVDTDRLAELVRRHLLLISGNPRSMRATTVERYYLRDERLGRELLALQFADGSATLGAKGKPSVREYRAMRRRIAGLLGRQKKKLPQPFLDGYEIMKLLKLKPGPQIGKIIEELREAQLGGKVKTKIGAKNFIISSSGGA